MGNRKIDQGTVRAAMLLHGNALTKGKAVRETLQISRRTIERAGKRLRETGTLNFDSSRKGRPSKLGAAALRHLGYLVEENPAILLDEIAKEFRELGFDCSISTYSRLLAKLGFSRKKLSKRAVEQDDALRAAFKLRMQQYTPEQLVFVDETAKDDQTGQRRYGWARSGERARYRCPFVRGKRFSLLPALHVTGYLTIHLNEGAVDREKFKHFLREDLLKLMNPYPLPKSVLVMDNCIIHHHPEIVKMVVDRGCKLEYLPPYSPDLNPIEESFSALKHFLRRHQEVLLSHTPEADLIWAADRAVTARKAAGWFKHSGYLPEGWRERQSYDEQGRMV